MSTRWFKFSSPTTFYPLAGKLIGPFAALTLVLLIGGLYWAFFQTPNTLSDQKEYYRIIFIHVPAAWMSMWLYAIMVLWSAIGLVFNTRLSYMLAQAVAPTGAMFCFVSLVTGAVWGKTSWGTWWDWDPRLTSQLILFFLYIGYLALHSTIEDPRRSDRASALIAIVGLVLLPVIYWSVNCPDPNQCTALHQRSGLGSIETNILWSMLALTMACWMYSFMTTCLRVRNIILERERNTTWVAELPEIKG